MFQKYFTENLPLFCGKMISKTESAELSIFEQITVKRKKPHALSTFFPNILKHGGEQQTVSIKNIWNVRHYCMRKRKNATTYECNQFDVS